MWRYHKTQKTSEHLIYAAKASGFNTNQFLYIGDHLHDFHAAHSDGMKIAIFTYCHNVYNKDYIRNWKADYYSNSVQNLWKTIYCFS
ncbi:MAG: hypothetical protein IR526_01580 [Bordetella sp.]|nr:MAG: hypothetical protein IR526_01580 [Bordetella sp.]